MPAIKKAMPVIVILLVIGLIVCSSVIKTKRIESIRREYTKMMDEKVENFLSKYDEYNVTDVTYQIGEISKRKGIARSSDVYLITLAVNATCQEGNLSETARSLIAYDVRDIFAMPGDVFYLGRKRCSYRPPLDGKAVYDDRITIYVNGSFAMGPEDLSLTGSSKEKCRNCGRSKDIVPGFGMCETCFEGFTDWQKDYYND